ncbi:hypothetical protein Tco_1265749 [Tanacetum coccineum]
MTTSNDGFNGVACGKTFRKKVLRKMTPHDQPAIAITNSNPNNTSKSGFLSRLIYLVTCAFWKRNPEEASITGTNEEQRNLANISAASEISNLETMPKQKTFRLLYIVVMGVVRNVGEGDKANIYNNAHVLRLKASISGPLNKHTVKGIKPISIPRAFEEDVASAVELAKARSRGRTTILGEVDSEYVLLNFSQRRHLYPLNQLGNLKGQMEARWSRSSVLYDLGSGGPMHRIRPKANFHPTPLLISSQPAWELEGSNGSKMARKQRKSEFVSSALNLLLCSEPERKASKAIVENGKTSMRNSGYAFVPTQSTQMASKILEHLERTSPKEKNSSSRVAGTTEKSANKLTSNLALGSLEPAKPPKMKPAF